MGPHYVLPQIISDSRLLISLGMIANGAPYKYNHVHYPDYAIHCHQTLTPTEEIKLKPHQKFQLEIHSTPYYNLMSLITLPKKK